MLRSIEFASRVRRGPAPRASIHSEDNQPNAATGNSAGNPLSTCCPMFKDKRKFRQSHLTAKKYFADWRDENGVRKRKGFLTASAAKSFQQRMQTEVRRKKAHASRPSARSRKPGQKASSTAHSPRSSSSKRGKTSRPHNSTRRSSKRSSRKSKPRAPRPRTTRTPEPSAGSSASSNSRPNDTA